MTPILRTIVAQVSREGRSILSRRNISSERCLSCGRSGTEGVAASEAGVIPHLCNDLYDLHWWV
ncbi:unnamed protein product [Arabis nemorensis]|uniref:Uncharacterized protein n=1 Tax=Arabis nemorensis TaxID=586526 RepID=A0A565B6K5_9BRAS|nr:unnamed protein product [Arabis nemorensis]